jgi:hypothetical protein
MRGRLVLSLSLAVLLTAALAAPAGAKPLAHEHYEGTDSWVLEDFCGTDWNVETTFSGNFMLKAPRGDNPTPYFFDKYRWSDVLTDANDHSRVFTVSGNGLWRDHRITLVEGTTYHFEVHEAGAPVTVRVDGKVLVRDRGMIVWEFTVDTKGDADLSNDVFVSDEGPTAVHGPHLELFMDDAQRCALLIEALEG